MKKMGLILIIWMISVINGMTYEEYESEYITEYETECKEEYETEPDIETELESVQLEESKAETELETEERAVEIRNVRFLNEEGYKYYDGTTTVDLIAEVWNLPDGMILHISGEVSSSDVGIYPVIVKCWLEGVVDNSIPIYIEETELQFEIKKRPLKISISNARKPYYSENKLENLFFDDEDSICISGFVEDEKGMEQIPDGFQIPKLQLDENIIWKEAPMYRDGEEILYEDAITLAYDSKGEVTGNATENYYFETDDPEYYRKGNLVLTQVSVEEGVDFRIDSQNGLYRDENGNIWTIPGDRIMVEPLPGCGFRYGMEFETGFEDRIEEFNLTERDSTGEVTAISQIRSIAWKTDGYAPTGNIQINGAVMKNECLYTSGQVGITVQAQDQESGIRRIYTCLCKDRELNESAEALFAESAENWCGKNEYNLEEEGKYRLYVKMEDMVGNSEYLVSELIVIDQKKPDIRITNIEENSANKGSVMPCISFKDEYLDTDSISVKLKGVLNGDIILSGKWEEEDGKVIIQLPDFPDSKDWDDVYELCVQACDISGNKTEKAIQFSVNRFGSTYYIENWNPDCYYYQKAPEILIHEVNVNDLMETEILVGRDEEVWRLRSELDYTMEKRGNQGSWKEYIYRIRPWVFEEEGNYYVVCSSKDQAENYSDNRSQKKAMEFAIDHTPPEVFLSGVENGEKYFGERTLKVTAIDNFGISEIQVWLNGEIIEKITESEVEIAVKEKDDWQEVQVIAKDLTGNVRRGEKIRFLIGEKAENEIQETEQEQSSVEVKKEEKNEKDINEEKREKKNDLWGYFLFCIPIFVCLKGILCFMKRDKKVKQ